MRHLFFAYNLYYVKSPASLPTRTGRFKYRKYRLRYGRMKNPSHHEEAALVAAFSLCDALDTINGTRTTDPPAQIQRDPQLTDPPARRQRPKQIDTATTWHGWHFVGDELIDGGGNRYGQSEIRAIFYTRKLLWHYQELERARKPIVNREPVQLCLEAVAPAWEVFCTR